MSDGAGGTAVRSPGLRRPGWDLLALVLGPLVLPEPQFRLDRGFPFAAVEGLPGAALGAGNDHLAHKCSLLWLIMNVKGLSNDLTPDTPGSCRTSSTPSPGAACSRPSWRTRQDRCHVLGAGAAGNPGDGSHGSRPGQDLSPLALPPARRPSGTTTKPATISATFTASPLGRRRHPRHPACDDAAPGRPAVPNGHLGLPVDANAGRRRPAGAVFPRHGHPAGRVPGNAPCTSGICSAEPAGPQVPGRTPGHVTGGHKISPVVGYAAGRRPVRLGRIVRR